MKKGVRGRRSRRSARATPPRAGSARYDSIGARVALQRVRAEAPARGNGRWSLLGQHNLENALAAIAAARSRRRHRDESARSARRVQRRQAPARAARHVRRHQRCTRISRITRRRSRRRSQACGASRRKQAHRRRHGAALEHDAHGRASRHAARLVRRPPDRVFVLAAEDLGLGSRRERWRRSANGWSSPRDVQTLLKRLLDELAAGDHVVLMSNGSFQRLAGAARAGARGRARRVRGGRTLVAMSAAAVPAANGAAARRAARAARVEPRYVDMIARAPARRRIASASSRFGEGAEVGEATTYDYGTSAEIVDWHQEPGGLLGIRRRRPQAVSACSRRAAQRDGLLRRQGRVAARRRQSRIRSPPGARAARRAAEARCSSRCRCIAASRRRSTTRRGSAAGSPSCCRSPLALKQVAASTRRMPSCGSTDSLAVLGRARRPSEPRARARLAGKRLWARAGR